MEESGRLFGKYRILRTIGNGGFAKVYLGEHIYLKTQAAVKVLRVAPQITSKELENFMAEARIIASLKHPHIIDVLDFDIERNIPYLVMSYAPHGSLHMRHNKDICLEPELILTYIKQVASALQFAHDRQIVHCDVKPENMLVGNEGKILLTDFGIAVALQSDLTTQEIIGTTYYMPPEQFRGRPVPASDQYALAISVYHWLCGKFPFTGTDLFELQRQHESVQPALLYDINPNISHEIASVVLTALAKDQRQRFKSITAFAYAFEQAVHFKAKTLLKNGEVTLPVQQPITLPPSITSLIAVYEQKPTIQLLSAITEAPTSQLEAHDNEKPQEQVGGDKSPRLVYRQHTGWISSVAWSPDGRLIASGSWDNTVQVWDPHTGEISAIYSGHKQPVKSVAWSSNGFLIASGSWDNTVQIWNGEGKRYSTYRHEAQVETVTWSPDGKYLASGGHDGQVKIWDILEHRISDTYLVHKEPIWSLSWSPDSHYLASGSHDGTIRIWEIAQERSIITYSGHEHHVAAVAWSAHHQLIASGDYRGEVHVWNRSTGRLRYWYQDEKGTLKALAWSSDGNRLASAVKVVKVRVIDEKLIEAPPPIYTYAGHTNWINTLAWSTTENLVASAGDDKTVQIWEISPKQEMQQ